MDITVYDKLLTALQEYNSTLEQNYGNVILNEAKTNSTFPYSVFEEITNDPYRRTTVKHLDSVDSLGYELTIYAKDKGTRFGKKTIARELAKALDDFLSDYVGLRRLSMNLLPNINDDSTCRINLRYTAKYNEYRTKIL